MTASRVAWLLAALVFAGTALTSSPRSADTDDDPGHEAFLGPGSCAPCHAAAYEAWAASGHALTLREARTACLPPDIVEGRTVEHPPGRTRFEFEGAGEARRYVAVTTGPDGAPTRYPVTHVVGRRRMHMFLTTLPDGRRQVLPAMLEEGTGIWFDYTHLIFGGPDADPAVPPIVEPGDPSFWTGPVRAFDGRCSRCHVSGRHVEPPTPEGRPALTTWRAAGVDCEVCHGPGAGHVDHQSGFGGEDPYTSGDPRSRESALDLCLRCHMEGEVADPTEVVGQDPLARIHPTLLDDASRVDPFGRPLELVYDGLPFLASRCAERGRLTCTTCHDPHGSPHRGDLHQPPGDSHLCSACHAEHAADVAAHAHHPANGPGGRCADCHMPPLSIERGHGTVTDHTIGIPRLDAPGRRVARSACAGCHDEGSPDGAPALDTPRLEAAYGEWWPDVRPLAPWETTLAAAREAPSVGADLVARLLRDAIDHPDAPRLWRASAVRLLGRAEPDAFAVLEAATRDADELVRREAVDALGGWETSSATELLRAALEDPSPGVRARAARAALRGWRRVQADPDLLRAILPVLAAEAAAVPEDDVRWFRLGAAYEIAGDLEGAIDAYARKVALDPFAHTLRSYVEELRTRVEAAGER